MTLLSARCARSRRVLPFGLSGMPEAPDPGRARLALRQLKSPETQEALCRLLMEHDHPPAREIAVPSSPTKGMLD